MRRDQRKKGQPPTSREDRILKPGGFPLGKIGSGYMATIAGQPTIRDMAAEDNPETQEEERRG
ncbi:hypothetical protein [Moorella sp. Hama-1]|uniref:hypothetical protein n=1 Tax=Moorella sp. Hama-1 TaxID=2138101 RepID=UPI000D6541CF|nr:hypothetical protein [Moorella sp. Hama-1]MDN5361098.1 hypothetical protein [Moorella sp. (in: firmicutes)]BCV22190.1 hypothetical protein hamaS1_22590 [Moorella sp. Hama-1]